MLLNYAGLFSLLLIVHLGLLEILADGLRLLGYTPQSLFDRPYLALTLRDFWSVRWNRAFVDMNKIFLLQPLRGLMPAPVLTFSIFAVSGLLHELGISYADGVSWGKPFTYFVLQGLGMELERRRRLPRLAVWLWILLPLPLLFTPAFTNLFCGQLERLIYAGAQGIHSRGLVPSALVLGGLLHLVVLSASVQVPGKLGWSEDFAKLRPLNRKVFWTYGAYIFVIIVFLSIVSFLLARETASAASLLWAIFIALFWWARVLTDFFYMSHDDWPRGPLFEIGHICLTTVFCSLAGLYSAIVFLTARAL
ncbi:MAG: wax synthase family protein [Bdellovibrionota bacterium]